MLETPPPWLNGALTGAVAALLLVGLVGAATIGPASNPSRRLAATRASRATTTSTLATTTTTSPTSTSTSVRPANVGSSATGAATGAPENLGPPGDPGQLAQTKTGTYRYHISVQSSQGNDEEDTDYLVSQLPAGTTGPRQRQTLKTKQGDQTNDVSWRSGGLYIDAQTFDVGGGATNCDWNPDIVAVAAPLAVGRSWTSKSHCSTTAHTQIGDVPLELDLTLTGKVSGTERVRVGADIVDVWVISGTLNVTGTSSGSPVITEKGTYTSKVAPKLGIDVARHDDIQISSPQGSGQATSDRRLLSIQPTA